MTAPAPSPAGYGLRPANARKRAGEVRVAVHPGGKRLQRPLFLLVAGGVLGIVGWLGVSYLTVRSISGYGPLFGAETWIELIAYGAGVGLFSWAWELGDARRAIRVAVFLAIAGFVIWLVIALVAFLLVALMKGGRGSIGSSTGSSGGSSGASSGGGGDGGGGFGGGDGGDGGGGGGGSGGFGVPVGPIVGRGLIGGIGDVLNWVGGGGEAIDESPPQPVPCPGCGNIVDPNTMRLCPVCNTPVPGA